MNTPSHILDRLCILDPAQSRTDAQHAIELLYENPPEWIPLCERFSIPQSHVKHWQTVAISGHDVCPHIDMWLNDVGVTRDLILRSTSDA